MIKLLQKRMNKIFQLGSPSDRLSSYGITIELHEDHIKGCPTITGCTINQRGSLYSSVRLGRDQMIDLKEFLNQQEF